MRRALIAGAALFLSVSAAPAVARAQDEGATATTVDVGTTQVTRTSQVTRNTRDVEEVDRNKGDDDDSDKTGLWGLLGLLGLGGLAGLLGRKRDTTTTSTTYGATASGVAPPRASGATGTGRSND